MHATYVHTMHALTIDQCGAFCVRNVCTMHALTTDLCGAFRVCNVNFCARDVCTTHALTTDLCGARPGLPQLFVSTVMQ